MANHSTKIISLPKYAIREEGVVILPLKKWVEIDEALEDLEMYRSESLAKEIGKRRKAKEAMPLEKLLKKYHI